MRRTFIQRFSKETQHPLPSKVLSYFLDNYGGKDMVSREVFCKHAKLPETLYGSFKSKIKILFKGTDVFRPFLLLTNFYQI